MIIEKAFYSTCFEVIGTSIYEKTNEEHLRGLMLQKIYEQFQLNYWDTSRILPQCKYELTNVNKWCDIKVEFPRIIEFPYSPYGIFKTNWIEIKYLKRWNQKQIINDLIRLCLLPRESRGKIKENGRYFMLVKNSYIPKKQNDGLRKIFNSGEHESIQIQYTDFTLTLDKVCTYEFKPFYKPKTKNCFFSCYLIKILGFTFTSGGKTLTVTAEPDTVFKDDETQEEFANKIDTFIQK